MIIPKSEAAEIRANVSRMFHRMGVNPSTEERLAAVKKARATWRAVQKVKKQAGNQRPVSRMVDPDSSLPKHLRNER